MFSANMPTFPPEMMGPIMGDPAGFSSAMGSGMEAFAASMADNPGDMGGAFEAFAATAGPMMAEMGMPPEMFEAMGDMVGAAVGPAMMMSPGDASGGDMGAMMHDAVDMMMPSGQDMPPEVGTVMMDMGTAMGDSGCAPHDVAGEIMPPPGDPGYPMPLDAAGEPMVTAGDPASLPADTVQSAPEGGAMSQVESLMPPEGGHEHAPAPEGMTMSPPMTLESSPSMNSGDDGGMAAMGGTFDAQSGAPVANDVADGGGAGEALGQTMAQDTTQGAGHGAPQQGETTDDGGSTADAAADHQPDEVQQSDIA